MSRPISDLDVAHIYEECIFPQNYPHLLQEKSAFVKFFNPVVDNKDPNNPLQVIHKTLGIAGKTTPDPKTGKSEGYTDIKLLPVSNKYHGLRQYVDDEGQALFIVHPDGKRYIVRKSTKGKAQYDVYEFNKDQFVKNWTQSWFYVNKSTGANENLLRDLVPAYSNVQIYGIEKARFTKPLQQSRTGVTTGGDVVEREIEHLRDHYGKTMELFIERGIQGTKERIVQILEDRDFVISVGGSKLSEYVQAYTELVKIQKDPNELKTIAKKYFEKFLDNIHIRDYHMIRIGNYSQIYKNYGEYETRNVDWDRLSHDFLKYFIKEYLSKNKIQNDIIDSIIEGF